MAASTDNKVSIFPVLSFDPGGTTGWSCLTLEKVYGGDFPEWRDIESLILKYKPACIVAEDFLLYPEKAKALYWNRFIPVRVLGVIQFLAEKQHIPLCLQTASTGKTVEVKKIKGFSRHAHDALRHAIYYAEQQGEGKPFRQLQRRKIPTNKYPRNDGLEKGF